MMKDVRVQYYEFADEVSIYDRLGSGFIELTTEQAVHVRDRLNEVLDDG